MNMKSEKINICDHCDELFYAQRSTARFCSTRCRVANHRGAQKPQILSTYEKTERLVAMLYEQGSSATLYIEQLKHEYGVKATRLALLAITEIINERQ